MPDPSTDKFRKTKAYTATTLATSVNDTDTTIVPTSVSGWPTDCPVTIVIDRVDANGTKTNDKREIVTGAVVGGELVNCVRGEDGTTAQSHTSPAVIELLPTATDLNTMVDGLLVSLNSDGTLKDSIPLAAAYPIGSVYINAAVNTNPASLLGFGTWASFGAGRVLIGVDSGQTEFDTLGETGGEKTHTLGVNEMPSHSHTIHTKTGTSGAVNQIAGQTNTGGSSQTADTSVIDNTGGGAAHNNLQPYITVYMWKRTA